MYPPPPEHGAEEARATADQGPTILPLLIVFAILTWIAVALRLYTRIKPVKCLSWDDLFVFLAASSTTIGSAAACMQVKHGLGKHWENVDPANWEAYLFWTYFANPTYAASLSLIKISVLLQYIRLCTTPAHCKFRNVCYGFIGLSAIWGAIYFFLMIFGCNPVSGFWHPDRPAKCVLYGSRKTEDKVTGYVSHSASNMALDLVIFFLPLHFFYTMQMEKKTKFGIIGIFSIGAIIVTVAIIRFAHLIKNRLGLRDESFDVTFYAGPIIVLSSLELMIATIAASIPIFWPLVVSMKSNAIYIFSEVSVKSEKRFSRVDSAAKLRDDWQPLEEYQSKSSNDSKELDTDRSRNVVSPWMDGPIPKNLVYPGTDTTEPALHCTQTTVQGNSSKS